MCAYIYTYIIIIWYTIKYTIIFVNYSSINLKKRINAEYKTHLKYAESESEFYQNPHMTHIKIWEAVHMKLLTKGFFWEKNQDKW